MKPETQVTMNSQLGNNSSLQSRFLDMPGSIIIRLGVPLMLFDLVCKC